MTTEPLTIREPSAWLRQVARHRILTLTRLARSTANHAPGAVIVASLTPGLDATAGHREDHTCDRCRTYCPPSVPFGLAGYPAQRDNLKLVLILGLCEPHMRVELPDLDQLNLPNLDGRTS